MRLYSYYSYYELKTHTAVDELANSHMRVRELIDSAGIKAPFFLRLQKKNADVVAADAPRAQHMQKRSIKALLRLY
jgi:hypothetical protein